MVLLIWITMETEINARFRAEAHINSGGEIVPRTPAQAPVGGRRGRY